MKLWCALCQAELIWQSTFTIKHFNLAALKVGDFTCKIIVGIFYFGKFKPHNSARTYYANKCWTFVGIVSVFAPFNYAVLFSSLNLQNKGHMNIKGFTVLTYLLTYCLTLVIWCCCMLVQTRKSRRLHIFSWSSSVFSSTTKQTNTSR